MDGNDEFSNHDLNKFINKYLSELGQSNIDDQQICSICLNNLIDDNDKLFSLFS